MYALYFAQKMRPEQYQAIEDRLIADGHAHPSGRLYHFVIDTDEGIDVFDVWDSPGSFDAFRPVIRPLLEAGEVAMGAPQGGDVRSLTLPADA
ncbi:MAG: hypothetical protein QM729_12760 [Solirubrobacterales bacterium]